MRDAEIAGLVLLAERRKRAVDKGSTWGMLVGVVAAFWLMGTLLTLLGDSAARSILATVVFFGTVLGCALVGAMIAKARFVP